MRSDDAGYTLPELLIAMLISGILIVSISMAFTTVLRTQGQASARLRESKDITFVQTWLPVDLSSALETFDTPSDVELLAGLAGVTPPMTVVPTADAAPGTTGLPGTNVITVVRPDLSAGPGVYYIVSYRYHQVNGEWQISRFEIHNPGQANQVTKTVGVAHEIPAPPPGWDPSMAPTHAAVVTARNQVILRPIGEDVELVFDSGNTFKSGGAGLSAENQLPASGFGGLTNPSAPPSRCGGRMALVLDSSGSIGGYESQVKAAANSFINSFSGTPYYLTLNGFDTESYGMTGTNSKTKGVRAPYVSLLNGGAPVAALNTRVNNFSVGGYTNWADGLNIVFRQDNGTFLGAPYGVDQPDLIVFITDGDPNRGRSTSNGNTVTLSSSDATAQAQAIANDGRSNGTETIGIMVGPSKPSNSAISRLKSVVGNDEWDGRVNSDGTIVLANAATADLFRGSFDELGDVLRAILIAECGGTLTLQKRIDVGGGVLENPASGAYSFDTSLGSRTLDRAQTSSITFDYAFAAGQINQVVEIRETTPGLVFKGAQCTAGGIPIASPLLTDGTAGVSVTVSIDKAVSCLMISEP